MRYCKSCNSERILVVSAKCSDCCSYSFQEKDKDGYVPSGLNIGGGDYLEFAVCLACGMMQKEFPVSDEALVKAGLLENADA
jgi:hypothetical protein